MERIDLSDAFLSKLEKIFPGALLMEEQLVRATRVLSNHGFKESNSIALVCQCRDELTLPFEDAIKLLWGSNFNISSLAGMMFCGKTGLQAGMAHAPRDSKTGMERYVFFVGPHIAIDTDGNVGKVMRLGHENSSSACGSLMAFHQELSSGRLNVEPCSDDIEQTLVKQKLIGSLEFGSVPSLASLTKITHTKIIQDLKKMIASTIGGKQCEYAIISGVLIHGPENSDFFSLMSAEIFTSESKKDIQKEIKNLDFSECEGEMKKCFLNRASNLCLQVQNLSSEELAHIPKIYINASDYDGRTALHIAASDGDNDMIAKLIQCGANGSLLDRWGHNSAETAYTHNKYETVKLLVQKQGVKLSFNFCQDKIISMCAKGDFEGVKLLVESCEDAVKLVNTADYDKRTPLMLAADEGYVKIVEYLMRNGADKNAEDRFGCKARYIKEN